MKRDAAYSRLLLHRIDEEKIKKWSKAKKSLTWTTTSLLLTYPRSQIIRKKIKHI